MPKKNWPPPSPQPKPRRPNNGGVHHCQHGTADVRCPRSCSCSSAARSPFALAANGIVFGLIGIELGLLTPALFQALPERIFGIMANDTLLAIPFFTFMAWSSNDPAWLKTCSTPSASCSARCGRPGLRRDLRWRPACGDDRRGRRVGHLDGPDLAAHHAALRLRQTSGRRRHRRLRHAAQIIPPSLVLIIMADQLGKSVGDMYEGAMIPGLILTGLCVGYVVCSPSSSRIRPGLPPEARTCAASKLLLRVMTVAMVPPLLLIFLVLGTIFLGIATPTEGGAMVGPAR